MYPLLANLSSIIIKDLAMDAASLQMPPPPPHETNILDDADDDDEMLTFFMQQDIDTTQVIPQWTKEFDPLSEFDEEQFVAYLHVKKNTYVAICDSLQKVLKERPVLGKRTMPAATIATMSFWKLTSDEDFQQLASMFAYQVQECRLMFRYFLDTLSEHYEMFIKWPSDEVFAQQIAGPLDKQGPPLKLHFPGLCAVVCIKCVPVYISDEQELVDVVIQVVCDLERKIIDCFVEYREDYSFEESPIGCVLSLYPHILPSAGYLIGNAGCPLRSYIVRAFSSPQSSAQRRFNSCLTQATDLAANVLNSMAGRFCIFQAFRVASMDQLRKIVEASSAIHNLCVDQHDDTMDSVVSAGDVPFVWPDGLEDGLVDCDIESPEGIELRNGLVNYLATLK